MKGKFFLQVILIVILLFSGISSASETCLSEGLYKKLEEVIDKSVSLFSKGRHLEVDNVLGRKVLKLKDDLSPGTPKFVDSSVNASIKKRIQNGETNLDLMKSGNAPIGSDGKQINLHHLLGEEPGPMAELESTIHKQYHKELHDMIDESFRRNKTLQNQFKSYRRNYWKERAKDFG